MKSLKTRLISTSSPTASQEENADMTIININDARAPLMSQSNDINTFLAPSAGPQHFKTVQDIIDIIYEFTDTRTLVIASHASRMFLYQAIKKDPSLFALLSFVDKSNWKNRSFHLLVRPKNMWNIWGCFYDASGSLLLPSLRSQILSCSKATTLKSLRAQEQETQDLEGQKLETQEREAIEEYIVMYREQITTQLQNSIPEPFQLPALIIPMICKRLLLSLFIPTLCLVIIGTISWQLCFKKNEGIERYACPEKGHEGFIGHGYYLTVKDVQFLNEKFGPCRTFTNNFDKKIFSAPHFDMLMHCGSFPSENIISTDPSAFLIICYVVLAGTTLLAIPYLISVFVVLKTNLEGREIVSESKFRFFTAIPTETATTDDDSSLELDNR